MYAYDTDKGTFHSYLEVYDELFEPYRESANAVLEIGVCNGGSIALWNDYFPRARIVGLDLTEARSAKDLLHNRDRCDYVIADAYTDGTVDSLSSRYGQFDIIVDDGPHTLESFLFVAREYPKLLKQGGVLVIEDVQSIDWVDEIIKAFPEPACARVEDRRSIKNRWDDIMIIYKPNETKDSATLD